MVRDSNFWLSNLMAFFVVACQQLVNAGRLFCRFIENQCTSNRVWHFIFLLTILRIFFIKNITSTSQLPIGIHTEEFQIGNCSQYVTRLLWYVAYYQVHIHAISWSGFFSLFTRSIKLQIFYLTELWLSIFIELVTKQTRKFFFS